MHQCALQALVSTTDQTDHSLMRILIDLESASFPVPTEVLPRGGGEGGHVRGTLPPTDRNEEQRELKFREDFGSTMFRDEKLPHETAGKLGAKPQLLSNCFFKNFKQYIDRGVRKDKP